MTALTLKIMVIFLASFGLFFLSIGIYASDLICILIGALLECAALLVLPEIRRIHRHPFR
ncbi:hypothetical protein [Acinetobacter sp. B51(2017)]|uniref:hypothetical protein n=1 Tax=Acinetobacter sp. B51(2017) TaxID=2060938 RepID=UPI000F09313A|nr:hypothetical protein [Acinetobacter sp. B51(2017)]